MEASQQGRQVTEDWLGYCKGLFPHMEARSLFLWPFLNGLGTL
jgi:hypothetical protein